MVSSFGGHPKSQVSEFGVLHSLVLGELEIGSQHLANFVVVPWNLHNAPRFDQANGLRVPSIGLNLCSVVSGSHPAPRSLDTLQIGRFLI